MEVSKSLFYFVIAGLCEIGGGYLAWLWLRELRAFHRRAGDPALFH